MDASMLLSGCVNWGPVVPGRVVKSHQPPRAASSYLCSETIYKGQAECSGTPIRMDNRTAVFYVNCMCMGG